MRFLTTFRRWVYACRISGVMLATLVMTETARAQQWERLSLVTQSTKDFFAARAGNPAYPEAANFRGGEGGQWPQGWAVSGDGNVLLWGTDVGGMARSVDGGATWTPSNYGFNARGAVAFAIDPKNANRALVVGGNGGRDWVGAHGVYLTTSLTDALPEWSQKLSRNIIGYRDIREQVAYDESSFNAGLGYCTTAYWSQGYLSWYEELTRHNAIHKTTDGGQTWTELHLDNAEYNLAIIKVHPSQGYVYLANGNGFYKSTDGGVSFTKKFNMYVTGMDVVSSAGNHNKVFLSTADGVYISTDSGETFTKVASSNFPTTVGTFMPAYFLKVSPADPQRMMLQIETNVNETPKFVSTNGGVTWTKCVENTDGLSYLPFLSGRVGYALWHPTNPNRAWAFGSDAMQTSYDGGAHFRWAHNGLPAVMGREFNFSTTTEGVFVIPTQDYDVSVTKDNGKTWKYLNLSRNGWGGYFYGAYSSDGNVVVAIEKNSDDFNHYHITQTRDFGNTVTKFKDNAHRINGYHIVMGDPHDANILFAGEFRSADGGLSWQKMNGCRGVFIASPTGNRELYGVSGSRTVVRSADRGVTWLPIGEIPNDIVDIAFDHSRNRIYATAQWNFYQLDVVTKSVTEITSATPGDQYNNRRFYQVAVDPVNPDVVYTAGANHIYANDAAVRRSVDGGQTWTALTRAPRHNNAQFGEDGAREAEIVRVNPWTRELVVGTNCYGTWKIGPPPASTAPGTLPDLVVTNITWTPAQPKAGDAVVFKAFVKNNSTHAKAGAESLVVNFDVDGQIIPSAGYTAAIAAGAVVELTATWTATAGNHTVAATADPAESIAELSDSNNRQSAAVIVQQAAIPATPTSLAVSSKSTTTIGITWDSAPAGIIGYRVYRDGVYADYVTGTAYSFNDLVRYTEYTLSVTALDATGGESLPASVTLYTEARGAANTIAKINTPLTIDGTLDEQVWTLPFSITNNVEGTTNNTSTYGMVWDDDNLYIGVKVLDNTLVNNNPDVWQNDGVQIFINGNRGSDASAEQWYWYNDLIGGKVMGQDNTMYEIWNWDNNHMNLDDVTHKTQLIPGGYTIEFSIPWGRGDQFQGIGWETGFIGKTIGVDVWNFDNDGSGRQSATSWRGNWENQWKGQWLGDVVLGGIGGDTEAPSIPANLSGVAGATKITLTWNTSTDNSAVAEYFIYQSNTRIAEVNASADPTQSFVVEGLAQNTAFSFRIKSVDESGNVSAFSNTLSITTLLDNVAPTAPANLSAQNITSTSADLSWNASTDNFGVTKYQVFRNAVQVGETTGTTFQATGLSPLTSYALVVKALDEVGNISDASGTLTVVTPDHHITRAASAATSVVVDGTLDETVWQSATASEVTKRIEGTTDNQLSFKTAWDTQNLYVAATLLDADLYANAGQFWSTDALEVYIDANNSRDADYDADDRQFTRVINAGGTYGSGGPTQAGVAHAWGTTTGGYTMEMSIPWTNLGITPTVGMTFAFDVGNNDDDNGGGRDGVLMWNGTGENWHNTRDFGKIVLIGPDTGRVVIQPTCTGNPAATRGWQLSSTYTTAKTVSWSVQGSALTGTVVIPAQGTYWLETQTQSGANQLTVAYGDALTVTKSNTGSSCTMTFTSMCSTNPAITRRWRVMSTYPVSVPFTWQVFGTAQTGSGTVAAGGLVYFETQTVPGANTTILSYDGKSLTKASGGQTCADGNGAVLSVMSETSATKLSLYPNPSSSTVTVQLKERARGVSILTLMGNTMWQKESFVSDEEQVDVRAWAAGTYVVKVIYATGRVETQKLVVK